MINVRLARGTSTFEVTHPAGQLMELERCRDYDITPLILRQLMEGQGQDLRVPQMISSMAGVEVKSYSLVADLDPLIRDYLRI